MIKERGLATLLVTTLLLVMSLVFSLASYKNVFYQIKRTQNEVMARKAHWLAEGGVECSFAINKQNNSVKASLQDYTLCSSNFLEVTAIDTSVNQSVLKAKYDNNAKSIVSKSIQYNLRTTGAIQARSKLKIIGDFDIYPDVTGVIINDQHQCVSIRYADAFYYQKTVHSDELEVFDPKNGGPYPDFLGSCLDTHKSKVTETANTLDSPPSDIGPVFKSDIVKDNSFKPFESFFGKKESEIKDVKKEFKVISGSTLDTGETCDKKVADAFKSNDKVWVEGDCDLYGASQINTLPKGSRVLVIENGILATHSASVFSGVIYHLFRLPIPNMTERWSNMWGGYGIGEEDKINGVYYQNGSFVADGGFIFDAPGKLSIIRGSVDFTFVGGRNPISSNSINWDQGSWHDF